MRAKKVLEVLGISRATLSNYVKEGRIKTHNSATQWIDYDDESVYAIASKGQRKNVIYARVMKHWKGIAGKTDCMPKMYIRM